MLTTRTAISIALFLLCITDIHAGQVYKCTIDGRTTFSQAPCGEQSTEITVTPQAHINTGSPGLAKDYKKINQEADRRINKIRVQRKIRSLKQDLKNTIKERKRVIASYKKKMTGLITQGEYIIYQNEIAATRTRYNEAITLLKQRIQTQQKLLSQM